MVRYFVCAHQGDAFVQRCGDLLDVCLAQQQFKPSMKPPQPVNEQQEDEGATEVPQTKRTALPFFGAFQTESIHNSIKEIEKAFRVSLTRLKAMGREVLHVKATSWHTEYSHFKAQVTDSLTF